MTTVMVQMMDRQKTLEALHFAGVLARNRGKVALVKMLPVQHLGWLGTELGYANFTDGDSQLISECQAAARNYDVAVDVHVFQYVSLVDAITEVANDLDARIVFAELPHSSIPLRSRFHCWLLRQRLIYQDRQLYLFEHDRQSSHWTPAILIPAVYHPGSRS